VIGTYRPVSALNVKAIVAERQRWLSHRTASTKPFAISTGRGVRGAASAPLLRKKRDNARGAVASSDLRRFWQRRA
jgi:hypothetical protein